MPLRHVLAIASALWVACAAPSQAAHALCNREFTKADIDAITGKYDIILGTLNLMGLRGKNALVEIPLSLFVELSAEDMLSVSDHQITNGEIVYVDGQLFLTGGPKTDFGVPHWEMERLDTDPEYDLARADYHNAVEEFMEAWGAMKGMTEDEATAKEPWAVEVDGEFTKTNGCSVMSFPLFKTGGKFGVITFHYTLLLVQLDDEGTSLTGQLLWYDAGMVRTRRSVIFKKTSD